MPAPCRTARRHCGHVRGFGEIVSGAGRYLAKDQPLGGPAGEQNRDLVVQLVFGEQKAILSRALDRVAERADPARNNRDLLRPIDPRQKQ
jgi:hypothetical protein